MALSFEAGAIQRIQVAHRGTDGAAHAADSKSTRHRLMVAVSEGTSSITFVSAVGDAVGDIWIGDAVKQSLEEDSWINRLVGYSYSWDLFGA